MAASSTLRLDVFAYDLNEPDVIGVLLKLAKKGRVRVILDNASLHHGTPPEPEDQFETLFREVATGKADILRGKFGRFAHDKIFIVSNTKGAKKVLTGATNLSVTGLYVNSNHVLVYDDPKVAGKYAEVFEESWNDGVSAAKFRKSALATATFSFTTNVPPFEVTFSPHNDAFAKNLLDALVARINKEATRRRAACCSRSCSSTTGPARCSRRSGRCTPIRRSSATVFRTVPAASCSTSQKHGMACW